MKSGPKSLFTHKARERGRAGFRLFAGISVLTVTLIVVLTHTPSSQAKEFSYNFTTLEIPFSGTDQTVVGGINDHGEIVGSYHNIQTSWHGFIYDRGQFTSFDVPFQFFAETHALGINNRGQIVGYIDAFPNGNCCVQHGFLLDKGAFSSIDVPGAIGTLPSGINDRGEIVGNYFQSNLLGHGFVLDRGVFTFFDVPLTAGNDIGWGQTAINNRGEIVGTYESLTGFTQGFLFERGIFSQIDTPPSQILNGTLINGINDSGKVVGCVGGRGAYLFEQGNSIPLNVPFGDACAAGINNRGQIVGTTGFGGTTHIFVATPSK